MGIKAVIIDYGLGNIFSVKKSLEYTISKKNINCSIEVSSSYKSLNSASHIVLPGQGAFNSCMNGLSSLDGIIEELKIQVLDKKKPILGICVGMQLLANKSFENGIHEGLGWIEGEIKMLPKESQTLPHMGWNIISCVNSHPTVDGLSEKHFYFVHSYYFKAKNINNIVATSKYGIEFPSIVAKNNILGVQFHPEKSSYPGQKLLSKFLN